QWSNEELASGFDRTYRMILKENRKIPEGLMEKLRGLEEVEFARLREIGYTKIPSYQITMSRSNLLERAHEQIYLREAQSYSKGDPEIKIAILDTGLDLEHPEIIHSIGPGKDFVDIIDGAAEFIGDYM